MCPFNLDVTTSQILPEQTVVIKEVRVLISEVVYRTLLYVAGTTGSVLIIKSDILNREVPLYSVLLQCDCLYPDGSKPLRVPYLVSTAGNSKFGSHTHP